MAEKNIDICLKHLDSIDHAIALKTIILIAGSKINEAYQLIV